jgi:hypothetical protein
MNFLPRGKPFKKMKDNSQAHCAETFSPTTTHTNSDEQRCAIYTSPLQQTIALPRNLSNQKELHGRPQEYFSADSVTETLRYGLDFGCDVSIEEILAIRMRLMGLKSWEEISFSNQDDEKDPAHDHNSERLEQQDEKSERLENHGENLEKEVVCEETERENQAGSEKNIEMLNIPTVKQVSANSFIQDLNELCGKLEAFHLSEQQELIIQPKSNKPDEMKAKNSAASGRKKSEGYKKADKAMKNFLSVIVGLKKLPSSCLWGSDAANAAELMLVLLGFTRFVVQLTVLENFKCRKKGSNGKVLQNGEATRTEDRNIHREFSGGSTGSLRTTSTPFLSSDVLISVEKSLKLFSLGHLKKFISKLFKMVTVQRHSLLTYCSASILSCCQRVLGLVSALLNTIR